MSETNWLVLRCASCGQCSGHRSGKGRCPHCGLAFPRDAEVVASVARADALQMEVALANTPDALRDELRQRMERDLKHAPAQDETPPTALFQALRETADEVGEITSIGVQSVLTRFGAEQSVEELMTRAEAEGLVLRRGPQRWMLLE